MPLFINKGTSLVLCYDGGVLGIVERDGVQIDAIVAAFIERHLAWLLYLSWNRAHAAIHYCLVVAFAAVSTRTCALLRVFLWFLAMTKNAKESCKYESGL